MENNRYNVPWLTACAITACLLLSAICVSAQADKILLTSGSIYNGKLLKRTQRTVKFRVVLANGAEIALDFPADKVKDVIIGDTGEPDPPKPKPKPKPKPIEPTKKPDPVKVKPPTPITSTPRRMSSSAIKALVIREGKKLPDWWDSVKLDYPKSLDLAGTRRAKGWQPRINLGAYFFSLVTPHPNRWKSGIKLLHHVVDVRKNDKLRRAQAMGMLGNYYLRYTEDNVRAAYWKQQTLRAIDRPTLNDVVGLAECYWRLGNTQMAAALLKTWGLDRSPSGPGIKLWAELGQSDRALKLAMALSARSPHSGFMAAGNLHRLAGRYDHAIASYDKVLAAPNPRGHGKLYRQRAQECGFAVRLTKTLNISKTPDGTHTGMSMSYRGPLYVEVKVSGGRITSARVTRHKDDIFFASIEHMPKLIVKNQSVEKLDAVSGATVTSEAIVNAVTKALAGRRN
ncbi:MAG: FMN-binding protein [Phycisphaerae bacterium]|nr:FMN-binding protein [Phycisphaerae bacterium]